MASQAERYPEAQLIDLDMAPAMLSEARPQRAAWQRWLGLGKSAGPVRLAVDAAKLPLKSRSTAVVCSNVLLHWLDDPLPALAEAHRVLEVCGLLMFSTLGPDTLKELRDAFDDATGRRVHRFIDMHDIGDVLVRTGFGDPVMDMELISLTYPDIDTLLDDLRRSAWNNASVTRPRGLTGKDAWQRMRARLQARFRDGRLPVSFEVVQGHAWKTAPKTTGDGRAVIQFKRRAVDEDTR